MTDNDRPQSRLEIALRRLESAYEGVGDQVRQLREAIETCRERGTLDEKRVTEEVLKLENRTTLCAQDINILTSSMLAITPQRRRSDKP